MHPVHTRRLFAALAALAALAVSAAPASAHIGGKMHLEDISLGVITERPVKRKLDNNTNTDRVLGNNTNTDRTLYRMARR
jgi:hypothetical protein